MRRNKIIAAAVTFVAAIFLTCSDKGKDVVGGGSETDNPALVSGHLYKDGGPAVGARVFFVKVNYNPRSGALEKAHAISDTVTTDSSGLYGTDDLDSGTYNVFGVGTDGNLSLLDSVTVSGDSQVVPPDTLKAPASLAGYIKLQPGDEPDKIFAIAMGSNTFSLISTAARFNFTNLAEGQYSVKFFSTLDNYSNYDTTFTITAGENRDLGTDSIVMPLKIPIPTGFTLQYDTLRQIVTLSWNRMNPLKVAGYKVYRQHIGSVDSLLTQLAISDTFYIDSTGIQNETYAYRVGSVNLTNQEGLKTAGDRITIENAYYIADTLFTAGGKINAINVDKHGVYVVVRFITASSDPAKIERYSSDGTFLNSWDIPNGIEHSYTFNNIVIDDSNFIYAINSINQIIKFDDTGAVLSQFQFPGTARGMSILSDTLYIGDFVSHNISAYSTRGDSLFSWGSQGFQNGTFENIVSIICDSSGSIYIEDASDYGRVQVFNRTGVFVRSFSFERFAEANGYTDLIGTQLDNKDSLILVTGTNVYGFSIEGTYIFKYLGLSSPRRAFFDAARNIKVALWNGEVVSLGRK